MHEQLTPGERDVKSSATVRAPGTYDDVDGRDSTSLLHVTGECNPWDASSTHNNASETTASLCKVCFACVSLILVSFPMQLLTTYQGYIPTLRNELAFFWMLARFMPSSTCSLQSCAYGTCSCFL